LVYRIFCLWLKHLANQEIVYKELPNGAEIDYSTDEPKLIEAIPKWFDAQLSDHARHAVPGHPHHSIHHKP
jgi:hypothetical protein